MGATNRVATAYVAESTIGTTPATPAFKALRFTSNSLEFKPTRVTSNEIRADRQVTDQILVDLMADGAVGLELSYNAYDDMIEAALQGTWSSNQSIINTGAGTPISALSTTTATVTTPLGTPFVLGMLAFTGGFVAPANNNLLAVVASSSATTIVFPAATFTVDASPLSGAFIRQVGFSTTTAADIQASATGLTSTILDFTTLGIALGEYVKIGGDTVGSQFATVANNSWARVSVVAAHAITFSVLPAGWGADVAAGKTIQVFTGDIVSNGIVQRGFTLERQQQDIVAPSYETFIGSQINTLSLILKAAANITGSLGFIGQTATASTTRTAGATDIAAPTFSVMNAASNVGRLVEGGTVVAGPSYITDLSYDLNNNLARRTAVGTLGSVGTRDGEVGLSGTLTAYFGDIVLLNKVLNDTQTSLMFKTGRPDGNRETYVVDIPQAKLEGTAPVSGKNQDRSFQGKYAAYRHPTLGYTTSVSRFWYLPIAN